MHSKWFDFCVGQAQYCGKNADDQYISLYYMENIDIYYNGEFDPSNALYYCTQVSTDCKYGFMINTQNENIYLYFKIK